MPVTKQDLIKRIQTEVDEHGVNGYARRVGINAAYISRILRGEQTIGPKVLSALGFKQTVERVVTYTKLK